jgi:hypothetical protein
MSQLQFPFRERAHQVATDRVLRDIMPMDVERNHLEAVLHVNAFEDYIRHPVAATSYHWEDGVILHVKRCSRIPCNLHTYRYQSSISCVKEFVEKALPMIQVMSLGCKRKSLGNEFGFFFPEKLQAAFKLQGE